NATLLTAGSQTITATDTVSSSIAGTSNAIAVSAGAASHFTISTPAAATAGAPFTITVTALDAFNNVAMSYDGIIHFTSSDGAATLPPNSSLTNGTGSFSATLRTAGSQTITANDGSISVTSNPIAVGAAAATHFTIATPASANAGAAFSITVTAFDGFNNVASSYGGTIHFTSSDGTATLPGNSTLTGGSGSFSATLRTAGSQTITASDGSISITSNPIAVAAAAAAHFTIAAPPSAVAGAPVSVSVTAFDSSNNIVTNYGGTIHFTSSDALALLPADAMLANGTGTFNATLNTAGSQTITATDSGNAAISGTSGAIAVAAAAPAIATLSLTTGLTTGGLSVTITGTSLAGATLVTFGGVAATIVSSNATSIVVTTPAHAAGAVDVVVVTPGGTATAASAFTFVAQIPTLSFWMLILLGLTLATIATVRMGGL
ncbi:MAG TPA: IPT/TIG domain-containing protein, partial [Thermoanaerobaculia bacterium]|nr:IPT/TIG domain-containing protein [Thermoanaerobaculia bacterium]